MTKIDNYYQSIMAAFLEQCIEVNINKVATMILQRSVVIQTVLGGLTMHPLVANFLWCIRGKNYESWLAVDKVIAII